MRRSCPLLPCLAAFLVALSAQASPGETAEAALSSARALQSAGLVLQALRDLDDREDLPAAVRAALRVRVLVDHGLFGAARHTLRILKDREGGPAVLAEPWMIRTRAELLLGSQTPAATKLLESHLSEHPQDTDAWALRVEAALRRPRAREIVALLDRLRGGAPESKTIRWTLLDALASTPSGDRAVARLLGPDADLAADPVQWCPRAVRIALAASSPDLARAWASRCGTLPEEIRARLAWHTGGVSEPTGRTPLSLPSADDLAAAARRLGKGTLLLQELQEVRLDARGRRHRRLTWIFGRTADAAGGDQPVVHTLSDPLREEVERLAYASACPGGRALGAPAESFSDLADPGIRLYYGIRRHDFRLAELGPGCRAALVVEVREQQALAMDGLFGDEVLLYRKWPVEELLLRYTAPPGLRLHGSLIRPRDPDNRDAVPPSAGVPERSRDAAGREMLSFTFHDLPTFRWPEAAPAGTDLVSAVLVSSKQSMADLARWYLDWAFGAPPAVSEKRMREVFGNAIPSEPEEILRAAHTFAARNIRYVGLEFGVHGYRPYPLDRVLERRFGDCKDKVQVLRALLAQAGIQSYPVLVRSRAQGRLPRTVAGAAAPPAIPLEAFDHALLAVDLPGRKAPIYVDPTASSLAPGVLPSGVLGATALVLDPGAPRLIELPIPAPSDSTTKVRVEAGAEGARIRITTRGLAAAPLRLAEDPKELVRRWLAGGFDPDLVARSRLTLKIEDAGATLVATARLIFPTLSPNLRIRPVGLLPGHCTAMPGPRTGFPGVVDHPRLDQVEVLAGAGYRWAPARTAEGDLHLHLPSLLVFRYWSLGDGERVDVRWRVLAGPGGDLRIPAHRLERYAAACRRIEAARAFVLRLEERR